MSAPDEAKKETPQVAEGGGDCGGAGNNDDDAKKQRQELKKEETTTTTADNNKENNLLVSTTEDVQVKMPPNEADGVNLNLEDDSTALTEDDTKVKFSGGANATAVNIGDPNGDTPGGRTENSSQEGCYQPLSKSELMPYATDKSWIALRWVLFIGFWVIWVAMLVTSVIIIYNAPKCPPPTPKEWWQKQPVYQVFPKSFKDTNADGKGDIKGITSKLDYLAALGVGSICLAPIYKSPQENNGYDVQDFQKIDETYGSLEDFKDLLEKMHLNGLKLIMDFVLSHSSDQHEWFKKSSENDPDFADFYVWKGTDQSNPPNDWKNPDNGQSAWSWDAKRNSWYLSRFGKNQPEFNLNNPQVVKRLEDELKYWLDIGVDGFRFTDVASMIESDDQTNLTPDLNKNLELLGKFRNLLDSYTEKDIENPRIMMTDSKVNDIKYYGVNGTVSQIPINYRLLKSDFTAETMKEVLKNYIQDVESVGQWPNFMTGSFDTERVASRFGENFVDSLNMIMMLLPGTPITIYGEELGMANSNDNVFISPMQWDKSSNGGFTSGTPWVSLTADFESNNVETQMEDDVINSHIKVYQELTKLRSSESVLFGNFNITVIDNVLIYTRVRKGNPGLALLVNFGDSDIEKLNIADDPNLTSLPEEGSVLTRSYRPGPIDENDQTSNKKRVVFNSIPLKAKEGLIISYVPK